VAIPDNPRGFLNHYLRPAASFFAQSLSAGTAGPTQVAAFETALDASPEAIFVQGLDSMCPALLTRRPLPPIYLDLDDIEHVKVVRQLRQPPFWPGKYLYYLQVPALVCGERRAIKLARKSFVCSDLDRDYLARRWRLPRVVTLPNAVSIPAEYGTEPGSRSLLLVAAYAYGPNIISAEFLVKDVWPLVREACPDARLIVAGNKPERIPSFARKPVGVEFTGFVPDLAQLYRRTAIVCCPILSGGGTRIKILEASAHGKAVVSTVVGAEGLELRDGVEIILRDGARAFADGCIELLGDPARREALGRAAREAVARRYDRRQIVALVKDEIAGRPSA
jgi:glycosyltransferase involved in cell wall biosynthesis